jgi:DNA-binding response OmpR family regulator
MRILLIEDNEDDTQLIADELAAIGAHTIQLAKADQLAKGLQRLKEGDIDVVLLDLSLPDSKGLETVERVRSHSPGVPIIVLTGSNDVKLAVQAIKAGAADYLVKGNLKTALFLRSMDPGVSRAT